MKILSDYPKRIVKILKELNKNKDEFSKHKIVLELGETILTHLTGILFGEYKEFWEIDENLEGELYRNSKKLPSFGVFLGFLRLMQKANGSSILDSNFKKGKSYPKVSNFVFKFELLKNEIVNKGHDDNFTELFETASKGRSKGSKSILQFFETFIVARNIYAHPEEKAKNPTRTWPLNEKYFEFINPSMQDALSELLEEVQEFSSYKPIYLKEKKFEKDTLSFLKEYGDKTDELEILIDEEKKSKLSSETRYLLSPEGKLHSKFYQTEIPSVNPEIAPKLVEREKAKIMEPVLLEMIKSKLEDKQIDTMEYLVLKETAISSFISEKRLRELIEAVKSQLNISEDVFIDKKQDKQNPVLNPYWLVYFAQLKDSKVEKSSDIFNTTNLHKNMWKQMEEYVYFLINEYLNNDFLTWECKSNQFQIGNLAHTYWGQIYPENSPFQNGFSVGFIVSKSFNWVKVKKNNPLKEKLSQPCILVYTTLHNRYMDDVDYDRKLQDKYGEINFELLEREKDILTELGAFTNGLSYRTGDIHGIGDYFEQKETIADDERVWIYSKVWNISDFEENGVFSSGLSSAVEKEIVTFLSIFSNSVTSINDFAITNGFNYEQLKLIRDKATENQNTLFNEIRENSHDPNFDYKKYAEKRGAEMKLREGRVLDTIKRFEGEKS